MNEHDSAKMAGILAGMGYECAESDADADLILFNTCTVREHAHHKAISEIGRAAALKKRRPGLIVGVCGCVAQLEKGRLFERYPELDLVFGPDQIHRLAEFLKETQRKLQTTNYKLQTNSKSQIPSSKLIATELIDEPEEYNWMPDFSLGTSPTKVGHPRVSTFIKIMKGCNNNCSFCIVPKVRGQEISRPADDIVAEVRALATQGVKEVTLLGQNVNSYLCDKSPPPSPSPSRGEGKGGGAFVQLVRRISNETDVQRIRYTSPHPKDLGDDLIEEHAGNPRLCRHVHLPLQAGSDKILKLMQRAHSKVQYLKKVERLREKVQGIEITTDLIVGFPGETEADFQDTLSVVREAAFDGMFAFKYSPRPGTAAAEMADNVPQREKEERLQRLLALNAEIWKVKTSALVGTVQEVLVEGVSKKNSVEVLKCRSVEVNWQKTSTLKHLNTQTLQMSGRTFGNKIVNFSGNLDLVGHIVAVRITSAGANSLKGEVCNSSK